MKLFPARLARYIISGMVAFSVLFLSATSFSQVVTPATKKKISIGVGVFSDIWMKMPANTKSRTINQGFNIFATYNVPFGKSPVTFAIGLGLSTHNLYGNYIVDYIKDSTAFAKIPDSVSYKRSKIAVTYLELPIEFRIRTNIGLHFGLGFKVGYLLASSSKYVGEGQLTTSSYTINTTETIRVKYWRIKNIDTWNLGPTLRIGYKWFNLNAYYSLTQIFSKGKGPETYPISVGILLMPF